jgi:hypothetical protein
LVGYRTYGYRAVDADGRELGIFRGSRIRVRDVEVARLKTPTLDASGANVDRSTLAAVVIAV